MQGGPRDNASTTIVGHLMIRDADTGAILVNQRASARAPQKRPTDEVGQNEK